jgi:hypothetical protein
VPAARQHYQEAGWLLMSSSDETAWVTITALDRTAFAVSARLAAWVMKGYQQGFIPLERLS